ncbi:uncharacterized protein METZ01_LOCUS402188 [marine metagenome]|uniref:tRNA-(Ms[2]io[6]A)-hydroxylase n=1 Tax=marine metagenome TaxID=408172 RepID=A0A382VSD8_9ZZZZ
MNEDCAEKVKHFLVASTPRDWIETARRNLSDLLIDHANCELRAASTAIGFIYKYPDRTKLCYQMSRIAREELRHFEQVKNILSERMIVFEHLKASRYASCLRNEVRVNEPHRLFDKLVVGALIEARSCERFAAMIPHLPKDISSFYIRLVESECRHFENYMNLAVDECDISVEEVNLRVFELKKIEADLVTNPDSIFRFHSGVPTIET